MTTDSDTSINLPDHPVRKAAWYQLFHRLARGVLNWGAAIGFCWTVFGSDIAGMPLNETMRLTNGGLCLIPFGLKVYEARKGIV